MKATVSQIPGKLHKPLSGFAALTVPHPTTLWSARRSNAKDCSQLRNDRKLSSERSTAMSLRYHCDHRDQRVSNLPCQVGNDVRMAILSHCLTGHEAQGYKAASPYSSKDLRKFTLSSGQPLRSLYTRVDIQQPSAAFRGIF